MNLYPAIDLLDGKVVRLTGGRREERTVYPVAPVDAVRRFAAAGARWIHVVDLDRVFGDGNVNQETVRAVVEEASRHGMRTQVGGGLRAAPDLEAVFHNGAARVVLGTVAVLEPERLRELLEHFGGRVAAAIDAKDGEVVVRGWTTGTGRRVEDVADAVVALGIRRIVYTNVGRDGRLGGLDVEGAVALAKRSGVPVLVSGGAASIADVEAAAAAGLDGVIVGRALYEGKIDLAAAVETAGAQVAT